MPKRKPRTRKAAAPSRASPSRGRIGPLWWGAGLLALGWIAFDANRPAVERHMPQLAALRLPWDASAPSRREPARAAPPAAPARPAPARPVAVRPAPVPPAQAERPAEIRTAALRPPVPAVPAPSPATPPAPLPAHAPKRGEAAAARPAVPPLVAPAPVPAAAVAGGGLVTRAPTALRRAPSAGAPVWMVLEAGRPLRVTRREGGFVRVESGIFTGWVEAAVAPEAAARPAAPRAAEATTPTRAAATTMPTLAAAEPRRSGPVPSASVPAR